MRPKSWVVAAEVTNAVTEVASPVTMTIPRARFFAIWSRGGRVVSRRRN
jgi:hypothetical protein